MCGIVAYAGQPREGDWGETHRLIEAMLVASEHRGRHATGFTALVDPLKGLPGPAVIDKSPIPASRFVRHSRPWRNLIRRRCDLVIGHVRWATHGSPRNNANNHPFVGRRGLHLVHNGVLADYEGVCERRGLHLTTECDSEAILRVVEANRHPALGLVDALRQLRGSMAVALLDARSHILWLGRNDGRPLWLLRLRQDRRCFIASERNILLDAVSKMMGNSPRAERDLLIPLASGAVHGLSSEGSLQALPTEW